MNKKNIAKRLDKAIAKIYKTYLLKPIITQIRRHGGTPLLVGGAVRDICLNEPIKDIDIEVHIVPLDDLEKILKQFGPVRYVGKAFGVLRIDGLDIDWSVPRTDTAGRKPKVSLDPFMGFEQALERRDVTINAMAINLNTHELIDPFNGLRDLKNKKLRSPNPYFFKEDPLRLFRVMQFIGRFNMKPDAQLNKICKVMDIFGVSRERIEQEFSKLLLKSERPSLGIRWLEKIGRLKDILPELAVLKKIKQDKKWHPEGDVFEHTMQTLDAAAQLSTHMDDQQKLIFFWSALCHDLGKATTTTQDKDGIHHYDHDKESDRLARKMLKRITHNQELIDTVAKLSRYHMSPLQFIDQEAGPAAYKRLARKLAPETNLEMLALLSLADKRGRNPRSIKPLTKKIKHIDEFIKNAKKYGVYKKVEDPILQGRDIKDLIQPGPEMGRLLKRVYEIQLEKGIKDKAELKKRLKDMLKN